MLFRRTWSYLRAFVGFSLKKISVCHELSSLTAALGFMRERWPRLSLKVLVSLQSHCRYLWKVCCPPPSHWLVSLHRQSDNRTDMLIKALSFWIGSGRVPFCTSFNPSSISPSPLWPFFRLWMPHLIWPMFVYGLRKYKLSFPPCFSPKMWKSRKRMCSVWIAWCSIHL